jgi:nucleotide-binding universal stress UspA family protein
MTGTALLEELAELDGQMARLGHSHLRNLIIGYTTTAMIRSCKIPVLLFR